MHNFLPFAWFEGQCIPFNEAKLSIATHALHYGTAAFGGMRAIPDQIIVIHFYYLEQTNTQKDYVKVLDF